MPEDPALPGGNPPVTPAPPGPPPLPKLPHAHQLTGFPTVAVILLHYLTCGVFSIVWLNVMHGRLPKVRSDDPSAGQAVGFCFIPFFNLYWFFFTFRRLCVRVDEQRELYGLPPSNLRGLATATCVFGVIPYINALVAYTILMPIYAALMQSSVNQLADRSVTTTPRATLAPQPAGSGMPGWAIALICIFPAFFMIAILSAMLLPALAAAKRKAQMINSVNNLKQVGLAMRIWESEHNGQFPFHVSQAQGGALESCQQDANGFELNPAPVFMVMSNELSTTRILVCPNDPTKHAAADFASLTAANISYELRTGPDVKENDPQAVLAVDPFNGEVLYADGSVQRDLRYRRR